MNAAYQQYLKSNDWKEKKAKLKSKLKICRCFICMEKDETLDVHHIHYRKLVDVKNRDLLLLCRDCHTKIHNLINIENIRFRYSHYKTTYENIWSSFRKYYPDVIRKRRKNKKANRMLHTD